MTISRPARDRRMVPALDSLEARKAPSGGIVPVYYGPPPPPIVHGGGSGGGGGGSSTGLPDTFVH